MSELSDYKRIIVKPMIESFEATIAARQAEIDSLRSLLSETRQFVVVACGDQAPYVKAGLARIDAALRPTP